MPEIMIPPRGMKEELRRLRQMVIETVERVQQQSNVSFEFLVGTMIELPRAAITADEIAEYADFLVLEPTI